MTMLARTALPVPQSQCSASLSLRAAPVPLHPARALAVTKATPSARSSSPRSSESWRSSWRTELENGSNGNGNGAHSHADENYRTAYESNGNGYHADDADDGAQWARNAGWRSDTEDAHSNGWHQNGSFGRADFSYASADVEEEEELAEGGSEEAETGGGGFFTDAFKDALKQALSRSPLYASEYSGAGSGSEESVEPEPYENEVEMYDRPIFTDHFRLALKESLERQQAELDTYGGVGSDDEYVAQPYVPAAPQRREMSPIEEVIATALGASQLHLRRLTLMKNEIEAAIERETKQVERLEFALSKTQTDMAYYKSLEALLKEREGR